jgi:hypothetical protein
VPTDDAHRRQARVNLEHVEHLVRTLPHDPGAMQWAVTAAFYCAVHCIEWHLAGYWVHSRDHDDRLAAMRDSQYGVPAGVLDAYLALKRRSERARYQCEVSTATEVQDVVMEQLLATITRWARL